MPNTISQIQVKRAKRCDAIPVQEIFLFGEPVYICDKNTLYIGDGVHEFQDLSHIAENLEVCDADKHSIFKMTCSNTNNTGKLQIGCVGCGFLANIYGLQSIDGNVSLTYNKEFGGISFINDTTGDSLDIGTSGVIGTDGTSRAEYSVSSLPTVARVLKNGSDFIGVEGMPVTASESGAVTTISCDGIKTTKNSTTTQEAKWDKVRSIYYGNGTPSENPDLPQQPNEGDIYIQLDVSN